LRNIFFFYLGAPASWALNLTFLDCDAEAMNTRLWQGQGLEITEKQIRKSLNFIDNEDEIRQRYKHDNFQESQKRYRCIENNGFILFSMICQRIYEKSDNEIDQIAINIFFQQVAKKYAHYYILQIEIRNNYGEVKKPQKKFCDFRGTDLGKELERNYVKTTLENSPQVYYISLSKCSISSNFWGY
jgi:hypothetical protein